MGAFAWISDFFIYIAAIVPRMHHVPAWAEGVKLMAPLTRWGTYTVTRLEPGNYWYWPVTTRLLEISVKRQTLDLPSQVIMTSDKQVVLVTATVVYEIEDVVKATVDVFDFVDTVRDVAAGCVKYVVSKKTMQELLDDQQGVDRSLRGHAKNKLSDYGIRVLRAFFTDFAPARVYRLVGDGIKEAGG